MKNLIIILICLSGCGIGYSQSPTWSEWFRQKKTQRKYLVQQIAALKVYLEYLKKGYNIVDKGLTTIGDIKNGAFNLDKDYFNSLKQVSPVVRNSPKVNNILTLQQAIIGDFRKFYEECRKDEYLSPSELDYIQSVYENMLQECNNSMDELSLITTSGVAEMKDDERLFRLDKVHTEMQDKYVFSQDFIAGTRLLSRQREREMNQLKDSGNLYTEI